MYNDLGHNWRGRYSADSCAAIYTALKQLGYHPYHMVEAMKDPKTQLALWEDALNAKYRGIGKPFGRTELDKILGNFDVRLLPVIPIILTDMV